MNTQVAATATATPGNGASAAHDLAAVFAKAKKLVLEPTEKPDAFLSFLSSPSMNGKYLDWTGKAPAKGFEGMALVQTADGAQNRLIAFANAQVALADATVAEAAYNWYIGRVTRAARDPENDESMFVSPAGFLSDSLSADAYSFQAKGWVELLKEQKKMKNLNTRTLKTCLENAPFARSQYPNFKSWEKLIENMAAHAANNGYPTTLFSHWLATRDVQVAPEGEDVTLDENQETIFAQLAAIDAKAAAKKAGTPATAPAMATPTPPAPIAA